MLARQRGVTAIGWLILLIPFAIIIYAGIRLMPVYLNYMAVARTLNDLTTEYQAGGATPDAIRSSMILGLVFVETLALFTLVIIFVLIFKG